MPRSGRLRELDRDGALDGAMRMFKRKSNDMTALHQLEQAMGVRSAASFYGAFGRNERLCREALARYVGPWAGSCAGA